MGNVRRVYVEKRAEYDVYSGRLMSDLRDNLGISGLSGVRTLNRYDVQGLPDEHYAAARDTIFAELPVDRAYDGELPLSDGERAFAVEYLPGQYDQRADSAAQCIQLLTHTARPQVASARVVVLKGQVSDDEFAKVRAYCINPVDSREAPLEKPETLDLRVSQPADVAVVDGFISLNGDGIDTLRRELGLAMKTEDILFCQRYFRDAEKRDPTITEIRVLDTYWSDHCRHTTFLTAINNIEIEDAPLNAPVKAAFEMYLRTRERVYGGNNHGGSSNHGGNHGGSNHQANTKPKDISLMDIATMGTREYRYYVEWYKAHRGGNGGNDSGNGRYASYGNNDDYANGGNSAPLDDLDVSDEINACSIVVPAEIDGKTEEWLVMFKNETHNHPTEIEPFGGAATCLGGAIRDPLSGRSYVYQAMRVTGSGDPRAAVKDTLPGKLPQRKITTQAAHGYSSYGNQIGLATGLVSEVYHEGYVAKRMEIGAVVGAAPKSNVNRQEPRPGDIVVLLGGRTGRDGCGGATGSSKEHTEESIQTCGAEVQKGNPPTERKIQRLFRDPEVSRVIRRCNDFGAGGVSVAIGELAAGLDIDLDAVPKKYEGLDGTELAISESQERMAAVIAPSDLAMFEARAASENLETAVVAKVTDTRRLRMFWRGKTIVDISRDFIDTNGAPQETDVFVKVPQRIDLPPLCSPEAASKLRDGDVSAAYFEMMTDINVCSQRGLVEMFDSSIGAGTVLMPFGGKYQGTPTEAMVAKLPVVSGETTTGTAMSYGFDPYLCSLSPFHGAVYAVIHSVAKIVAVGGDHRRIRLTLQEYFEKLGNDKERWGKPFAALLGAYLAQASLGIPAIGGKDSMSGTFKDLHVPPTLVSFALAPVDVSRIVSPEFKHNNSAVVFVPVPRDEHGMPDFAALDRRYHAVHTEFRLGKILAMHTVGRGGIAEAVARMCFGNRIGFEFTCGEIGASEMFEPGHGGLILELNISCIFYGLEIEGVRSIGMTRDHKKIVYGRMSEVDLEELYRRWEEPLNKVFPIDARDTGSVDTNVDINVNTDVNTNVDTNVNTDVNPYSIYGNAQTKSSPKAAKPRVLIPVFPGTNCEYDSARAFTKAGAECDFFVLKNIRPHDIDESVRAMAEKIASAQIIMIPGGFSAGDEPDGSAKFIVAFFRNPRIRDAVTEFLNNRDGLMLGICNGFQALIKLGLVPYGEIRALDENSPTLTFNTIGRHISRIVYTKVLSANSPWLSNVKAGDVHAVPISHGEGRFIAQPSEISQLISSNQVATRYVNFDGNGENGMNGNCNGSFGAIEGILSPDGRVFGKMGHNERLGKWAARNIHGNKDQRIFEAGVGYFG